MSVTAVTADVVSGLSPALLVSDRCRHTIREFLSYKQDHIGTSQADEHLCDSVRYAIHTNGHTGGGVATATVRLPGDTNDLL